MNTNYIVCVKGALKYIGAKDYNCCYHNAKDKSVCQKYEYSAYIIKKFNRIYKKHYSHDITTEEELFLELL